MVFVKIISSTILIFHRLHLQQQQQHYFIYTSIYNNFYYNTFNLSTYKWRQPVVTIGASWKQVAFAEEELQRLMVRIPSTMM